ncbi:MAG: hypothetical protein GF349_02440 [Candidatus Magasanikbacteria bacterium]|nr:hypothetical protein [Candidatus Magasanikbacteria bacterium]
MLEKQGYRPEVKRPPTPQSETMKKEKPADTKLSGEFTDSVKNALEKAGIQTKEMGNNEINQTLEKIKDGNLENLLDFFVNISGRKDKEKFAQWLTKKEDPKEFLKKQIDIYIEKTPEREAELADKKQREELTRETMEAQKLTAEEEKEIDELRTKLKNIEPYKTTETVRQASDPESQNLNRPETPPQMQIAAWLANELDKRDINQDEIYKSLGINTIEDIAETLNDRAALVEFVKEHTPNELNMAKMKGNLEKELPNDPDEVMGLLKKILMRRMTLLRPDYQQKTKEAKKKKMTERIAERLGIKKAA